MNVVIRRYSVCLRTSFAQRQFANFSAKIAIEMTNFNTN